VAQTILLLLPALCVALFAFVPPLTALRNYLLLLPLRIASYGLILQATGRTRDIFRGSIYYLIGNAVVSFVLLRIMGLSGPAWGTVMTTIAIAVWYLSRAGSSIGVGPFALVPVRVLALLVMASAVPAIAAAAVLRLTESGALLSLLVGGVVTGIGYLGLARVTRAMTNDDVTRLRTKIGSMVGRGSR